MPTEPGYQGSITNTRMPTKDGQHFRFEHSPRRDLTRVYMGETEGHQETFLGTISPSESGPEFWPTTGVSVSFDKAALSRLLSYMAMPEEYAYRITGTTVTISHQGGAWDDDGDNT